MGKKLSFNLLFFVFNFIFLFYLYSNINLASANKISEARVERVLAEAEPIVHNRIEDIEKNFKEWIKRVESYFSEELKQVEERLALIIEEFERNRNEDGYRMRESGLLDDISALESKVEKLLENYNKP